MSGSLRHHLGEEGLWQKATITHNNFDNGSIILCIAHGKEFNNQNAISCGSVATKFNPPVDKKKKKASH